LTEAAAWQKDPLKISDLLNWHAYRFKHSDTAQAQHRSGGVMNIHHNTQNAIIMQTLKSHNSESFTDTAGYTDLGSAMTIAEEMRRMVAALLRDQARTRAVGAPLNH